ncbi:MAG: hypothetical protein MZV70_65145 [Desulfobacterales bacterium]|nr:hypothetical protein [Desulfobacterales bacterium]
MYAEKGKPVELVNSIYEARSYKCCLHFKKVKRNQLRGLDLPDHDQTTGRSAGWMERVKIAWTTRLPGRAVAQGDHGDHRGGRASSPRWRPSSRTRSSRPTCAG